MIHHGNAEHEGAKRYLVNRDHFINSIHSEVLYRAGNWRGGTAGVAGVSVDESQGNGVL